MRETGTRERARGEHDITASLSLILALDLPTVTGDPRGLLVQLLDPLAGARCSQLTLEEGTMMPDCLFATQQRKAANLRVDTREQEW